MSTPLKVTELNAFSGGMNNVTAPYLIGKDEAAVLANVDLRRGAMWSMPRPIHAHNTDMAYFYQYKKQLYTYGSWRSNVLWDNKWYWSDGATTGKVLPDGTEKSLGLPTPVVPIEATPGGDGPHTGDFKYTYTFYDNATGVESAPAPLTSYITATDQDISLTGFETLPTDATHYRIYRIGGYLPYFMLVDMTDQVSFTDNLDDSQIDGRILETLRNGLPPLGLHHLTEMNGRMFGSIGNKLYFSALGNPDSWYIYDIIPAQDIIKGIAKAPGGLVVMGETWINLLQGTDPLNFRLKVLSDKVGLVDASSISYIDQNVIWLANHGICLSDGYTIRQLTADRIEDIQGIRPTGAQTLNNIYYMAFKPELFPAEDLFPSDTLYPNAVVGTGGIDQGILTLDFKRGNGFAYKIIDVPDIVYLDKLDGEIAIETGDFSKPLWENCDEPAFFDCFDWVECDSAEISYLNKFQLDMLNQLDHLAEIDYLSPLMVDGTTATLKEYDKVRVIFKGIFKVQVLFDNDRLIMERNLQSVAEWSYEHAIIGIPNEDNKAYSIRFRVQGRGVVKGIQYTYKNRDLP